MELSGQPEFALKLMPVDRFYSYIKWKTEFDEKVAKLKAEELDKLERSERSKLRTNVNFK